MIKSTHWIMKQRKRMKEDIDYNRSIRDSFWGFSPIEAIEPYPMNEVPDFKGIKKEGNDHFWSVSGVVEEYLGKQPSATSIAIKSKEEQDNG